MGERLCGEHTAIPFSDVLARGALAGLVKAAPEQIISTSNLNILKSRNNIESCWSYCKVLLRFFKQSQKQAGDRVNYLFTCVKPRNLAHGSQWWNGAGKPPRICQEKNCLGPCDVGHFIRRVLSLSEPHTWHGVWAQRNRGYKYPSSHTKNRDSFKAKESTGGKVLTAADINFCLPVCVSFWLCSLRDCNAGDLRIFREKIEGRKDSSLGKALVCIHDANDPSTFPRCFPESLGPPSLETVHQNHLSHQLCKNACFPEGSGMTS